MTRLKIEDSPAQGKDLLCCPHCGHELLHHDKVEVFDRAEDSAGLHVTVNSDVSVDSDLSGNPSSRRHGLLIHFWCECCEANSVLSIEQHKGVPTWVSRTAWTKNKRGAGSLANYRCG